MVCIFVTRVSGTDEADYHTEGHGEESSEELLGSVAFAGNKKRLHCPSFKGCGLKEFVRTLKADCST